MEPLTLANRSSWHLHRANSVSSSSKIKPSTSSMQVKINLGQTWQTSSITTTSTTFTFSPMATKALPCHLKTSNRMLVVHLHPPTWTKLQSLLAPNLFSLVKRSNQWLLPTWCHLLDREHPQNKDRTVSVEFLTMLEDSNRDKSIVKTSKCQISSLKAL